MCCSSSDSILLPRLVTTSTKSLCRLLLISFRQLTIRSHSTIAWRASLRIWFVSALRSPFNTAPILAMIVARLELHWRRSLNIAYRALKIEVIFSLSTCFSNPKNRFILSSIIWLRNCYNKNIIQCMRYKKINMWVIFLFSRWVRLENGKHKRI